MGVSDRPRRSAGWVGWEGTVEEYVLFDGPGGESRQLSIGVVAGSRCPRLFQLHAGSVWNGAVRLAQLIEEGFLGEKLAGKTVLELGAGAALPSLVIMAQLDARLRPRSLVISDYDDTGVIGAIEANCARNAPLLGSALKACRVTGHTWGQDARPLLRLLRHMRSTSAKGHPLLSERLDADTRNGSGVCAEGEGGEGGGEGGEGGEGGCAEGKGGEGDCEGGEGSEGGCEGGEGSEGGHKEGKGGKGGCEEGKGGEGGRGGGEGGGGVRAEGGEALEGFEAVLLADCLWDSETHETLLRSLCSVLARPHGECWMAHCHHWQGHEANDAAFFALARRRGLEVQPISAAHAQMACLFEIGESQCALVHRIVWADGPHAQAHRPCEEKGAEALGGGAPGPCREEEGASSGSALEAAEQEQSERERGGRARGERERGEQERGERARGERERGEREKSLLLDAEGASRDSVEGTSSGADAAGPERSLLLSEVVEVLGASSRAALRVGEHERSCLLEECVEGLSSAAGAAEPERSFLLEQNCAEPRSELATELQSEIVSELAQKCADSCTELQSELEREIESQIESEIKQECAEPRTELGSVLCASAADGAACSLLSLPEDVLEKVFAELLRERRVCIGGTRGPGWLAQLSATCTRARRLLRGPLLRSLLRSAGASAALSSLEALSVEQAVSSLIERGGARVGFQFSGTELDSEDGEESSIAGSRSILRQWARLLLQHPRLLARVDAHCGPTAPPLVARCYSRRRGLSVATELARYGVSMERVEVVGWGKALARAAAASKHANGEQARIGCGWAELFVGWPAPPAERPQPDQRCEWAPPQPRMSLCKATEMPPRPSYYKAAVAQPPLVGQADDISDGTDYSDAEEEEFWALPGEAVGAEGGESDGDSGTEAWEAERLLASDE